MMLKTLSKRNNFKMLSKTGSLAMRQQPIRSFAAEATYGSNLDEMGEPRFLENVQLFLKRAAGKLDIPADIYEYIEKCHSVVRFDVPLQMDNG